MINLEINGIYYLKNNSLINEELDKYSILLNKEISFYIFRLLNSNKLIKININELDNIIDLDKSKDFSLNDYIKSGDYIYLFNKNLILETKDKDYKFKIQKETKNNILGTYITIYGGIENINLSLNNQKLEFSCTCSRFNKECIHQYLFLKYLYKTKFLHSFNNLSLKNNSKNKTLIKEFKTNVENNRINIFILIDYLDNLIFTNQDNEELFQLIFNYFFDKRNTRLMISEKNYRICEAIFYQNEFTNNLLLKYDYASSPTYPYLDDLQFKKYNLRYHVRSFLDYVILFLTYRKRKNDDEEYNLNILIKNTDDSIRITSEIAFFTFHYFASIDLNDESLKILTTEPDFTKVQLIKYVPSYDSRIQKYFAFSYFSILKTYLPKLIIEENDLLEYFKLNYELSASNIMELLEISIHFNYLDLATYLIFFIKFNKYDIDYNNNSYNFILEKIKNDSSLNFILNYFDKRNFYNTIKFKNFNSIIDSINKINIDNLTKEEINTFNKFLFFENKSDEEEIAYKIILDYKNLHNFYYQFDYRFPCFELIFGDSYLYLNTNIKKIVDLTDSKGNFTDIFINFLSFLQYKNPNIKNEIFNYYAILKRKEDEKKDQEFKKVIARFVQNYQSNLNQNTNIHLNLYLEPRKKILYFKLYFPSNNKEYKIQSLNNFLYEFNNKSTKIYGKNTILKHSIENFDELSQKVLLFLFSNADRIIDENKIKMNFYAVNEFFNLYKNEAIFYNDEPILLRLNNLNLKIEVNESGQLLINKIKKYNQILNLPFYINKIEKVIDKAAEEKEFLYLFGSISELKPNISNYIEDFKYDVYSFNPSIFEINEKHKEKFETKDFIIEAYFDFENQKLINKTKLFYKDQEVKPFSLLASPKVQYNKYLEILKDLGFEDNEISDQTKIFNFFNQDLARLQNIAKIYLSESIKNKKIKHFSSPNIKISYESNMMQMVLEESSFDNEELEQILKGLKNKKKFIIFKDNIINLEDPKVKEFGNLVEDYDLFEDKKLVQTKNLPIYYGFKALTKNDSTLSNEFFNNIISELKDFTNYDLNVDLTNFPLRNYQLYGVKWLKLLDNYNLGGILADDMGLGKTLEVITFLSLRKKDKPVLIVTPTSLIYNWMSEFYKFNKDEKVISIYGSASQRNEIIKKIPENSSNIYITSYDSLRLDIENYQDIDFDLIILDEAQYIKNSLAKKTISVKSLKSRNRFVLTGTPIENSLLDLWSIFDFLLPGYFIELRNFKSKCENDSSYIELIKNRTKPFILKRYKEDVLNDLPPKYEVIMTTPMTKEERMIYDSVRLKGQNLLKETKSSFNILPIFTELREICVSPQILYENFTGLSSKMKYLKELIIEEIQNGHRILIFSQFVKALYLIKNFLDELKIKHFMIYGHTSSVDRLKISTEFNKNDEYKICLISLKAGGTGLNLIGADTVIHLDPWWNYAATNQASDRAHRIGQTKNVKIIKLISENSIEQKVLELQNIKKEVVQDFLKDDVTSLNKLSNKELLYLLSKDDDHFN